MIKRNEMNLGMLDGEYLIELGKRVRALRKLNRYTQEELADQVGVSRKLIIDIEAGKGTSLLVFVRILKEFNKEHQLLEMMNVTSISPREEYLKRNK